MTIRMKTRCAGAVLLASWCALAAAQAVYQSKDKAGPVFSDQPSTGAKPLHLPPPNVIQTPQTPAAAARVPSPDAVRRDPAPARYQSNPDPTLSGEVLSRDAVPADPVLRPDDVPAERVRRPNEGEPARRPN